MTAQELINYVRRTLDNAEDEGDSLDLVIEQLQSILRSVKPEKLEARPIWGTAWSVGDALTVLREKHPHLEERLRSFPQEIVETIVENNIHGIKKGLESGIMESWEVVMDVAMDEMKDDISGIEEVELTLAPNGDINKAFTVEAYLYEDNKSNLDFPSGYHIRHDDNFEPASVEKEVQANFFGEIFLPGDKKLFREGEDYYTIQELTYPVQEGTL